MKINWKPMSSVPTDGTLFWLFLDFAVHLVHVGREEDGELVVYAVFRSDTLGIVEGVNLGTVEDLVTYHAFKWADLSEIDIPK